MTNLEKRILNCLQELWLEKEGWSRWAYVGDPQSWHKEDTEDEKYKSCIWSGTIRTIKILHPHSFNRVEKKFYAWCDEFRRERELEFPKQN